MTSQELFTIQVPATEGHQGGSIVCTCPAPLVYLLTWNSPPDNRLTPNFISALMEALDVIEFGHPPGVVATTSAISKFYSNGLDLKLAIETPGFWENSLYALFRRFLTYPMPTVALLNGHAFAGGAMLGMHHDYRVFTGAKGFICVNELEFGSPLLPPMASIFRMKVSPTTYRHLVLEAKRFNAQDALAEGIIDAVGGLDVALRLIEERGLVKKGKTGVYGLLKKEMYRGGIALLDAGANDAAENAKQSADEKKRKAAGMKWFQQRQLGRDGGKAKL